MYIANTGIVVTGRLRRIARLQAEIYEHLENPLDFVEQLKRSHVRADLLTFLQEPTDQTPRHDFHLEWENISVLRVTTYDHWWKNQLNDKTRNMIRKSQKSSVEVRVVSFSDDLVKGIVDIQNESPVRQGKRFPHYGKDFQTTKNAHVSFLDRSDFIGAFYEGELIGYAKLVHGRNISSLMQIISKVHHRNRSPTNALIAKAVAICSERSVPNLHYGVWSKRGLGEFKKRHGFEQVSIPRYYVPLTLRGKLVLSLGLHHALSSYVPEAWEERLHEFRAKWNSHRHGA